MFSAFLGPYDSWRSSLFFSYLYLLVVAHIVRLAICQMKEAN